ncbi:hypothetical protein [Peribacillus acanthi]|uniref:hypothetical protein n=1 Tax=Peribacillus acanthi TaxID=2171554 RepID=UPI000D3EADA5|nr:hypothetical protein [Peribacillus acanthi]
MNAVYRKQGSMEENNKKDFIHVGTSVIVRNETLGGNLLTFYNVSNRLAKEAKSSLREIYLKDGNIVIEFELGDDRPYIDGLNEMNKRWEIVNDACKVILSPLGCTNWYIELEIYEEIRGEDIECDDHCNCTYSNIDWAID